MNFSLRQLRAFVAAAKCGSFTKAPERLHVTQAGLSAMIRELEVQVGCQLFECTTRMVTLSERGAAPEHPLAGRPSIPVETLAQQHGSLLPSCTDQSAADAKTHTGFARASRLQ